MIEAVVQTGSFETTYRRAGTGEPVLLLLGCAAPLADWLFRELAARYRVVAPVLPGPGDDGDLDAWLRGLIDGLGLERPALVSDAARGPALVRFAALDPDRVGRLALVGPADDPITRERELAGLLEILARPG